MADWFTPFKIFQGKNLCHVVAECLLVFNSCCDQLAGKPSVVYVQLYVCQYVQTVCASHVINGIWLWTALAEKGAVAAAIHAPYGICGTITTVILYARCNI